MTVPLRSLRLPSAPPPQFWVQSPTGIWLPGLSIDRNGFQVTGGIITGIGNSVVNGGLFTDSPTLPGSPHIVFKQGAAASIPKLLAGEPAFATDTKTLYVGDLSGNAVSMTGGGAITVTLTGAVTGTATGTGTVTVPTVATAGMVTTVVAHADLLSQTGALTALTYPTTVAGVYRVGAVLSVNSNVASLLAVTVNWTDENGNPQSAAMGANGTGLSVGATGTTSYIDVPVYAKSGTNITVVTSFTTGATENYNIHATIEQLR
jgi:hypothetical protein